MSIFIIPITLISMKNELNPHLGLSQKDFDRIVKLVPFVACEVLIYDKKKGILLLKRRDRYYKGWHIPGGLLRFRESFDERIQAVARDELGIHISSHKLINTYNYIDDPRGHTVGFVFLCRATGIAKNGKYFKTIPKNTLSHQKPYLKKVFALLLKKNSKK